MTTMSTSRPSTEPMIAPVITPAWMGTVEEQRRRRRRGGGGGVLEGGAEDNGDTMRIKRRKRWRTGNLFNTNVQIKSTIHLLNKVWLRF